MFLGPVHVFCRRTMQSLCHFCGSPAKAPGKLQLICRLKERDVGSDSDSVKQEGQAKPNDLVLILIQTLRLRLRW